MGGIWRFRAVGDLLLTAASDGPPDDETLDQVLHLHRSRRVTRGMMLCVGSAQMTPAQRKRAAEALRGQRSIAITDSAVTRGVVTAMSWLGSDMVVASPKDMLTVIEREGPPPGYTAESVKHMLEQLRAEVIAELAQRNLEARSDR